MNIKTGFKVGIIIKYMLGNIEVEGFLYANNHRHFEGFYMLRNIDIFRV